MAGFLDTYGAGDERRAHNIKLIAVSAVTLVVLGGFLFFFFRNYRQEQQVKRFYQLLGNRDYQAAYNMWVSSDSERRGYPLASFMQDWGPPVEVRDVAILDAETCSNNVIVDADVKGVGDRKIWVNRNTLELGFPPYDECPHQNRIYDLYRSVKYKLRGRTYK